MNEKNTVIITSKIWDLANAFDKQILCAMSEETYNKFISSVLARCKRTEFGTIRMDSIDLAYYSALKDHVNKLTSQL
jgi:hypothetical protein